MKLHAYASASRNKLYSFHAKVKVVEGVSDIVLFCFVALIIMAKMNDLIISLSATK